MGVHPDKTAERAVDACGGVYTPEQKASGYADGYFEALDAAMMAVRHVDALMADMLIALLPFANLGVTSGPDDEPCSIPYRITRGSIRKARAVVAKAEGK